MTAAAASFSLSGFRPALLFFFAALALSLLPSTKPSASP
jgi:hypothetical protein